MKSVDFAEVHAAELERIRGWRRPATDERAEGGRAPDVNDASASPQASPVDLVTYGLALSGGGIRSAAFCMGAVQALHARGLMDRFDYLSSVSGGGYTAATLQSWKLGGGTFPFALTAAPASDLRDAPAVQHIRDHSRYLMPRGMSDLVDSIAVVLRGLVASASLVIAPMLLLAAATVALNPDRSALEAPHLALFPVPLPWPEGWIGTTAVLLGGTCLLFGWALARSLRRDDGGAEFKGDWPPLLRWTLLALVVIAFLEVQPRLVAGFVALAQGGGGHPAQGLGLAVLDWIKRAAALLAPVAGIAALVVRQIQTVARTNAADPTWSGTAARIVAQALLLVLAAALPLLLWVSYLYLSFWGVECGHPGTLTFAPGWLGGVAVTLAPGAAGAALLYGIVGAVLLAASWSLSPNANSLHRLYRDRLARAFIFGPLRQEADRLRPSDEVLVATPPKLSDIGEQRPYPLINVALNIQGSQIVNKRGRNADFFLFSPLFVGSASTGYAATSDVEAAEPTLDLAAAIAISGAAASPDMGSRTMRVLTPTLAILNVRLGYWMRNPRPADTGKHAPDFLARWKAKLYLLEEMLGWLDERSPQVYLTDGGHIENLGIYELLRRRCDFIVAIDAEADPEMSFSSFVTLQRYARIDIGVRIELPWEAIRQRTRATSEQVRALSSGGPAVERHPGPHAVEGRILYPGGAVGRLLYVKSSLSGDENDYILDYKARNPAFPHEATADQFFSEEQFEAYRALGFHAAFDALKGIDEWTKDTRGTSESQDPTDISDRSGRQAEGPTDGVRTNAVPSSP